MTDDDWTDLEAKLCHAYGRATLLVDGFTVTLEVHQFKMQLSICVFVNGWMKGEWLTKKTEEATRFCRPVTVALFKPSDVKRLTNGLSKSAAKKMLPDLSKKGQYLTPEWKSFRSLKRHFIANNKSIELVKP